jgi:RNA polymerase sigma-70 factor, ECF subfamily
MFDDHHHDAVQALRHRLFGYACALCRRREDAEDLVQDALVRAMAAPAVPHDTTAFRVWMFRLIRNLWIDRLRRERRHAGHVDTEVDELPGPGGAENMIDVLLVRQAFRRLTGAHREVLALVDIAGFSYDESADILDIPRGTVMSRISRARAALACQLSAGQVVPFPRRAERVR